VLEFKGSLRLSWRSFWNCFAAGFGCVFGAENNGVLEEEEGVFWLAFLEGVWIGLKAGQTSLKAHFTLFECLTNLKRAFKLSTFKLN